MKQKNLLTKIPMSNKVLFNNSCSICRFEINHYKKISDNSFEWIDITNNEEVTRLTSKSKKDLLRRLHVIDGKEVISGAKAFIFIWKKIPKYRMLSKILELKIFFYFFNLSYEIVAFLLYIKNRKQLK